MGPLSLWVKFKDDRGMTRIALRDAIRPLVYNERAVVLDGEGVVFTEKTFDEIVDRKAA
jgi:hypothetical protein